MPRRDSNPTEVENSPMNNELVTCIDRTIAGAKKYKPTKPTWLKK